MSLSSEFRRKRAFYLLFIESRYKLGVSRTDAGARTKLLLKLTLLASYILQSRQDLPQDNPNTF